MKYDESHGAAKLKIRVVKVERHYNWGGKLIDKS
jgi:hypothetical protein